MIEYRKEFLRKLLEAQNEVNKKAPDGEKTTLIQDAELLEIRKIWRRENGDWADAVSQIVKSVMNRELNLQGSDVFEFKAEDGEILEEVCAEFEVPPQLLAQLLEAERSVRGLKRRTSIHRKISTIMGQEWRDEAAVVAERIARMELAAADEAGADFSGITS